MNDVLCATKSEVRRETVRKSDRLRLCKISKTACFRFESLIIYVLHADGIQLALYALVAPVNDLTPRTNGRKDN